MKILICVASLTFLLTLIMSFSEWKKAVVCQFVSREIATYEKLNRWHYQKVQDFQLLHLKQKCFQNNVLTATPFH